MKIDRAAHRLAHGADGASQLAKVGVPIARLDAFQRRAQLCLVVDRLRQHFELPAESHDLRLLRVRLCRQQRKRLLFGVRKAASRPAC